jgi:hypothetical protein
MRKTDHLLTASRFNALDQCDQEAIVACQGVYIAVRQEPEFVIRLYQLDNFYVELYYHQVSKKPISIRTFTQPEKLDAYLNGMEW